MKIFTSKEDMEQIFQNLASIKKVEPEKDLYFSIINRIERQNNMISLTWIRAAAAVFIILFSSEILLFKKNFDKSSSTELKELVPQTNNLLYHE
jgi:hypothetical protein